MDPTAPSRTSRRYLTVDYNDLASIQAMRLLRFEEVIRQFDTRLLERRQGWNLKPWQAAMTAELLEGRGVVVSAQSRSGKSMCYFLPITSPDSCVLVICLLLAFMACQVRSAEELGIWAVHLCAETIKADVEIIKAVRRGEFSMVFMTADFTSMANHSWKSLVSEDKKGRLPNFSSKLQYIVIDEVHLVHEWFVTL
jgi:superfamily II DNA helicase RecQ